MCARFWHWFVHPVTWRTALFVYFFFGSLDIMTWPLIWCTVALPPVAGLHVASEGWVMSRLLWNTSRIWQPLWTMLYVVMVVLTVVFSANGFKIFGLFFVSTDCMSLIAGTYIFATALDARIRRLAACFAIHGFITMVVTPMLLVGNVLQADLLYPFVLMMMFAMLQMVLVTDWLSGVNDRSPPLVVRLTGKEKLGLILVWLLYAPSVACLLYFGAKTSPQPCNTYPAMFAVVSLIFPPIGALGLMVPSFCRRFAARDSDSHDGDGGSVTLALDP